MTLDDLAILVTARSHAEGDHECGRLWSCWCAACRVARALLVRMFLARHDRAALTGGDKDKTK